MRRDAFSLPLTQIAFSFAWFLGLIVMCASSTLAMDERKTLLTAGPSWDGFTNRDGRGLYHDIIKQIFTDYKISHVYVPTKQANAMVAIGRADIKLCETIVPKPLIIASVPMYENAFYVVYKKDRIGPWQGDNSLTGRRVAWREGYYTQLDFSVDVSPTEVRSGVSALAMMTLDRVDFYVDDMKLIHQSFHDAGEIFDRKKYGLQKVGTRKYYPVFSKSPKGEALRADYEAGMRKLFEKGVLQEIYALWNFPIPEFSFAHKKVE